MGLRNPARAQRVAPVGESSRSAWLLVWQRRGFWGGRPGPGPRRLVGRSVSAMAPIRGKAWSLASGPGALAAKAPRPSWPATAKARARFARATQSSRPPSQRLRYASSQGSARNCPSAAAAPRRRCAKTPAPTQQRRRGAALPPRRGRAPSLPGPPVPPRCRGGACALPLGLKGAGDCPGGPRWLGAQALATRRRPPTVARAARPLRARALWPERSEELSHRAQPLSQRRICPRMCARLSPEPPAAPVGLSTTHARRDLLARCRLGPCARWRGLCRLSATWCST